MMNNDRESRFVDAMKREALYWSKLFQFSDEIECIEETLKSMPLRDAVAYLGDMYDTGEVCESDFTNYKPYCANNGTDTFIAKGNGYTLLYNPTIGGVYLLYREATIDEKKWWFSDWNRLLEKD